MKAQPMTTPILTVDEWDVREMILTWEKIKALWDTVKEIRALFSDLTQNDFQNFFNALTHRQTLWFEIWREEEILGIVWLTDIHTLVDATAHMMFLDSRPAEKKPVVRELIKWTFEHYPTMNRITVFVPESYHATRRLTEELGFRAEGRKRQAVLLKGHWNDLCMYGITRTQVERL